MQKLRACKNRDWLIHFFFSTSSVCMMAIWPVGPPNEMNPSFNQKRSASANDGATCRSCFATVCSAEVAFIVVAKMRRAHRSTQHRDAEFPHRAVPLLPNL